METENKDWKPEAGKTAWLKTGNLIQEMVILGSKDFGEGDCFRGEGTRYYSASDFFQTLQSAVESIMSIKVYDLQGREVEIPRANRSITIVDRDSKEYDLLGKVANIGWGIYEEREGDGC